MAALRNKGVLRMQKHWQKQGYLFLFSQNISLIWDIGYWLRDYVVYQFNH